MSAAMLQSGGLTARETGLWGGAAAVVLVAHLMIGYSFHALTPNEPPPAAEEALTIDLSPLSVTTPESVESEAVTGDVPQEVLEPLAREADVAQETTVDEAQPVEAAEAEPVVPIEIAEAEPIETIEPAEPVQTVTPAESEPVEQADPIADAVEPIEPDKVEPTEQPLVVETRVAEPVDQVLPDVVAALPQERPILEAEEPEPKPKPVRKTERKKPAPKTVEQKPAKPRVAEKTEEAKTVKAAPSKESAKSNASRAPSISPAKWQSRVIAWINRHKRYPSASKARGDQGQVHVNFAINASGVVISASIGRSSGNAALDKAALDMVRRASPVPAPPPEIARSRMQLALPVQFSLR